MLESSLVEKEIAPIECRRSGRLLLISNTRIGFCVEGGI